MTTLVNTKVAVVKIPCMLENGKKENIKQKSRDLSNKKKLKIQIQILQELKQHYLKYFLFL